MKILTLGDVVGPASVQYLFDKLRTFKRRNGIDFTVVNGENSAHGNGIDRKSADMLLESGADVITTGNHVYKSPGAQSMLDENESVIRPANFPPTCPGRGYTLTDFGHTRVLTVNVLGTVGLEPLACPFETVEAVLKECKGEYDISVLDIHAEATSEKAAIARCFDGRINVIFGTHTHVQTADGRILPKGSGFITDLGMCGPDESVLGIEPGIIIERLRYHMPKKFAVAGGKITAHGAIFTVEDGKTVSVEGIEF